MRVHGNKLFYKSQKINAKYTSVPALCTQPHVTASCGTSAEAWYFDGVSRTCKLFPQGQCMDGGNSFATYHECKQTCQPLNGTKSQRCGFNIMRECGKRYHAWYFDNGDNECKMLLHTACKGRGTVFPTESRCQLVCQPHKKPYPICSRMIGLQQCSKKSYNKWYFSFDSGKCLPLTGKLCLKGGNAFRTYPQCMKRCSYDPHGTHSSNHPRQKLNQGGHTGTLRR
uniref:Putative trilaris n=1 Tax=Rhipicephalus pulchellus TaxID=72859 RepID=L7LPS0_RHIPC